MFCVQTLWLHFWFLNTALKHCFKINKNTDMESLVSFNVFLLLMKFQILIQYFNSTTCYPMLPSCYLLYNSTIYVIYIRQIEKTLYIYI